jgi:hypothetical protein
MPAPITTTFSAAAFAIGRSASPGLVQLWRVYVVAGAVSTSQVESNDLAVPSCSQGPRPSRISKGLLAGRRRSAVGRKNELSRTDGSGPEGGSMGKRLVVVGAAIALTALAVGVVAPAFGSSGDDDNGKRVIRVVSVNTEEDFLDLGAQGFSLGDEFVFTSSLRKSGEEVGHTGVVCTTTSVEREEVQCVATASFSDGQITVQGLLAGEPETFVLPVTGGSGAYEGADGELQVREVSDTREILRFRLEG